MLDSEASDFHCLIHIDLGTTSITKSDLGWLATQYFKAFTYLTLLWATVLAIKLPFSYE